MADKSIQEPGDATRSSIDKELAPAPVFCGAVERLPDEIIEQILHAASPDCFASLILLNRKWRSISQQAHLYLHHLSQCPSFSPISSIRTSPESDSLPRLRRLFAREVKRNLFEAFVRPRETLIKLVSNSISSSSAPGGEGMQFSASPRGHHILAYNSSRIYVIDVRETDLDVKRELKILRRPASATITDDAMLLAVLSTELQVDLYDLGQSPPRRKHSLILDNTPRTIALSPCGSVLAAAYEGGIEVSSLSPSALPTDRRAVKCDAVDSLAFSFDGTQILGTTTHSASPNTVVLTAPYYDPGGNLANDSISALWTTSILFPNSSRDCSHAVLLQEGNHEEATWAFTYDRSFEIFRAVRIDDLRNGTTYFPGPVPKVTSQSKLLPCTLPTTTYTGELVSASFQGKEIWIYGIPEDLDAVPEPPSSANSQSSVPGPGRSNSGRSNMSVRRCAGLEEDANLRVPRWQTLCDKYRNNFVAGYKASELTDVSSMKWVANFGGSSARERLVVTARGISGPRLITDEDDIDFVDGGRITMLDFEYGFVNGKRSEITIEVGTNEAEILEEEQRDLETEVAIVRRRTVAQKRGGGHSSLLRAATAAARDVAVPPLPRSDGTDDDDPLRPRIIGQHPTERRADSNDIAGDQGDTVSIEEQEALDAPYAHASPRSRTTLRRAATAAAVNRTLHPRTADGRPIEYRRADGRAEHPHESDADNWVPPPPPYQKDDPGTLPAFLRGAAAAPPMPEIPPLASLQPPHFPGAPSQTTDLSKQEPRRTVDQPISRRPSHYRTASDSTTMSRSRVSEQPRPLSSPSIQVAAVAMDELYDVSPPASPRLSQQEDSENLWTSDVNAAPSPETSQIGTADVVTLPRRNLPEDAVNLAAEDRQTIPPIENAEAFSLIRPSTQPLETGDERVRRLSTVQTWPLDSPSAEDRVSADPANNERTSTEPAPVPVKSTVSSAFTPLPSSDQLASLNRRISQGHPRRLSGSISSQWSVVGDATGAERRGYQNYGRPNSVASSSFAQMGMEQPMIISTPSGISGAFDRYDEKRQSRRDETPILAPIPQRVQTNHFVNSPPVVERLEPMETIYSAPSHQGNNAAQSSNNSSMLPKWLQTRSTPSRRKSASVRRRRSRAERSAAKNMRDARNKGWKAKPKNQRKPVPGNRSIAPDYEDSSQGWTDVPNSSSNKNKKCVVM